MGTLLVTVQHLHSVPNFNGSVGYCARGGRLWVQQQGLDWATFVRDGLPAELLEATGDPMAMRLVAHARAQQSAQLQPQEHSDGQA